MCTLKKKYLYILYIITILSICLTLIIISFGSYTRLKHAGLGCPDWPGCYGKLNVPTSKYDLNIAKVNFPNINIDINKARIEMFHRYIASLLFVFIVIILCLSLFIHKRYNYSILIPILLFIAVIVQALFGMWTVTLKLLPIIVTMHLLGGLSILSLLFILFMDLKYILFPIVINNNKNYNFHILFKITIFILFLQLFLGGWVSSNYAGLGCLNFPKCNDNWLPLEINLNGCFNFFSFNNYNKEMIHFIHRFVGFICAILISLISYYYKNRSLFFIVFIQIILGILNVIYFLPIYFAVMHNFFASILLLKLIKVYYDNKRLH